MLEGRCRTSLFVFTKIPKKVWRYKRNSLSLHRQNIQGAWSSSPEKGCLFYARAKETSYCGTAWGIGQRPQRYIPWMTLTARSAASFICQNFKGYESNSYLRPRNSHPQGAQAYRHQELPTLAAILRHNNGRAIQRAVPDTRADQGDSTAVNE